MIGSTLIDAQRQSLEMVTEIQDRVLKANKEFAQSLNGMVDTLPVPEFKAPVMADTDFVGQAFDMTAEWLENTRKFTEDMLAAWMPEASKAKASASASKK